MQAGVITYACILLYNRTIERTTAVLRIECVVTPLKRIAPSFRTRRYFSHHSYRDNSLQEYPSLAGETFGTRIEKYRPLVMSLVHQRKEQHSLVHLYYTHKASTHKRQANDSVIYKMKAQSFV